MSVEILFPTQQVNASGLWYEVPSTSNQALLIDDGVATHDGDATYIWTNISGRYVTLDLPDAIDQGQIESLKFAFVNRNLVGSGGPGITFGLYLSGQAIIGPTDINLGAIGDSWTALEVIFDKSEFLATWVGLTGATWNTENASSPGARMVIWSKDLGGGGGQPPIPYRHQL